MEKYEEVWKRLTFHGFDQAEYKKKIPSWKKGAAEVCELIGNGMNCGVVADTAAGKTIIALLSIAALGKRTLFLTPQRLLDEQHHELTKKIDEDFFKTRFIHGQVSRKRRIWNDFSDRIVFATPQVVVQDAKRGNFDICDFELVVFDEMHRASGRYPYVQLAKAANSNGLGIMGLTASPGGTVEKIESLKKNLFLGKFLRIEVETPSKGENFVIADMDENLRFIEASFKELLEEVAKKIREQGVEIDVESMTVKQFETVEKRLKAIDIYVGSYLAAKYRKLHHAYFTAITEGYRTMLEYFGKMKREDSTKAGREIVYDERVLRLARVAKANVHPKTELLFKILVSMRNFGRTALVFVSQKNTGRILAERCALEGMKVDVLFGGSEKKVAKQKDLLAKLARREIDFIFTTSVAEEGLSIPEIDAVIQYSMPTTEISLIQRSGRTGRMRYGNVIFIALNHPFDKSLYYASRSKAKKMREALRDESEKENPISTKEIVPEQKTSSSPKPSEKTKKKSRKWVDKFTLPLFPEL